MNSRILVRASGLAVVCSMSVLAQSVIIVRADEPGKMFIDSDAGRPISAFAPLSIPVSRGKHLLAIVSSDGSARFEKIVDLLGGKEIVLADLSKIRAAKQAEQQARDEQQRHRHAREVAEAEQTRCQQRLKELREMLQRLSDQREAELGEARKAAASGERNGSPGILTQVASLFRPTEAEVAQQHQQKAEALEIQVRQLQTKMATVGECSIPPNY